VRRRLLVAILLLVAGTLVLAGVGGYALIRRASANTAEQQLYAQARALAEYPHPRVVFLDLGAVKYIGQYDALAVVGLDAGGGFAGRLPGSLRGRDLDPSALLADRSVAGHVGGTAFVLIPLELTTAQKGRFTPPVPYQDTAVLVATRT